MRSFSHWTPIYIYNRIKYSLYKKRYPSHPWLTQTSIQVLDSWLKPIDIGFEWGCGRSTLWFAKKVDHLTSIEHDELWYSRVNEILSAKQILNVRLLLRSKSGGQSSDYVQAIGHIPDNSLDFILVDGRQRMLCLHASLEKLRPGGLLALDNAEMHMKSSSSAPGASTARQYVESNNTVNH